MRKAFNKGVILLPFFLLFLQNIFGQGWVKTYDFDDRDFFVKMHAVTNGFNIISGNEMVRVDFTGELIWKTDLPYVAREAVFTDNQIVTVSTDSLGRRLVAYDYEGTVLWDSLTNFTSSALPFTSLTETQDGGTAQFHWDQPSPWYNRLVFEKRDSEGKIVLEKTVAEIDTIASRAPNSCQQLSDGGFLSTGWYNETLGAVDGLYIMRLDAEANIIWEKHWELNFLFGLVPISILETQNGDIVLTGWTRDDIGNYSPRIVRIDKNGHILWGTEIEITGFNGLFNTTLELPSGNLLLSLKKSLPSSQFKSSLAMLDKNGNLLWHNPLNYFPDEVRIEYISQVEYMGENRLVLGGYISKILNNDRDVLLVSADTFGNIYPHFLSGTVFQDITSDCQYDGDEDGFYNKIVSIKDGENSFYASTDPDGNYLVNLPSGNYEVSVSNMAYWESCEPSYSVSLDSSNDTTEIDLPMQALIHCPLMEVDICASMLRLCNESHYIIDYCNNGTLPAEDAYVEVVLADHLTFIGADLPVVTQNGQTLTFELKTVEVNQCNSFKINVAVTCDETLMGETQCTEAHIYPSHTCGISFIGPDITATGLCQNDSIQFNLINEGEDMQEPQGYIVIEDNIILMSGDFQLLQGETKTSKIAATTGATYHLVAAQAPNLPAFLGNHIATASVEGCVGEVDEGAFNQLPFDDGEPWVASDCHPIIASFDPNDKTAFPSGWAEDHIIDDRTDLEYLIRFQNTGTDTAFKVVIVDTLSQFLDPATIRLGAGSHPFVFDLNGQGVATFTFDNILLPDSTTNEPESHGFVKFRISQKPDNEIGTRIENTAYIYFDYNSAVQTNTVFHTIGEPWVQVVSGSIEVFEPGVQVAVFPNPFYEMATIELDGWKGRGGTVSLSDLNGKPILQKEFIGEKIALQRRDLPTGIYFFKIENHGKMIGTGKVVVR